MQRLPNWYPTILHGLSVVAVPVCLMAVVAWEHPFLAIMMMPVALIAFVLHLVAAITSARVQRADPWRPSDFSRNLSWLTAVAAPLGSVVSLIQLETFPVGWWAGAILLSLAHLAFVLETRPGQAALSAATQGP